MNPAKELRRLLAGAPQTLTGTVIAVDGQALKVRTAHGVRDAKSVGDATYRVDDEVLVKDGIVQGRVTPAAQVPVYYV